MRSELLKIIDNVDVLPVLKDSKNRFICPKCFRAYTKNKKDPYNIYYVLQALHQEQVHVFLDIPDDQWRYILNKTRSCAQYIKRKFEKHFSVLTLKDEGAIVVKRII